MKEQQEIDKLLKILFEEDKLLLASLSSPRSNSDISKETFRPLQVKGNICYQITQNKGKQAFHQNLTKEKSYELLSTHLERFKQIFLYTHDADYHVLISKKGQITLLKKKATKSSTLLPHNRTKEYFLREGERIPFLVGLGVMNQEGKINPAKRDKFRQINRFLEMIDDILPHFDPKNPLRVVDFGCGKAYLTFALFYFLKEERGFQVYMTGIDLKEEVILYCQELAEELGWQNQLLFIHGDIEYFHPKDSVDLMVSLHACDTATDAAIQKAIDWGAKGILSVPCCQHELMHQIEQETLRPLLKHGIMRERFSALVTDAARAQLLEVLGYQTQILEFIEVEHTAKNLLIRAFKVNSPSKDRCKSAWEQYVAFKKMLKIDPSLERRVDFENHFKN